MKPIAHLTQDLQKLKDGINKLVRTLPPIIGTEAVRMARLQIDKEGTLNGGFKPWPKRIEVNSIQVATQLKRKPGGKRTVPATTKYPDRRCDLFHSNLPTVSHRSGKLLRIGATESS